MKALLIFYRSWLTPNTDTWVCLGIFRFTKEWYWGRHKVNERTFSLILINIFILFSTKIKIAQSREQSKDQLRFYFRQTIVIYMKTSKSWFKVFSVIYTIAYQYLFVCSLKIYIHMQCFNFLAEVTQMQTALTIFILSAIR